MKKIDVVAVTTSLFLSVSALFFLPEPNQLFWFSKGVGEWYGELHIEGEEHLFVLAKNSEIADIDFGVDGVERIASRSLDGTTLPDAIGSHNVPQHTVTLMDATVLKQHADQGRYIRWMGGHRLSAVELRITTSGEEESRLVKAIIVIGLFSLLALLVGLYFAERLPLLIDI